MAESIIKAGRKAAYTVVYKSAMEDTRLPLDARGLLAVMVGLPDNWQYTISGLATYVGVGKDTIRRIIRKLEEVGYLVREQSHDAGGKFGGNVYILQDEAPIEAPLSGNTVNGENRQREKPLSGNPTQINNNINNIPPIVPQGGRRKRTTKDAPDHKPDRFAGFWGFYPRKENKQGAIRAWDRLKPDDELIARMGKALETLKASEAWQDGIGIPHAATWLNNRRWEDVEPPKPTVPREEAGFAWH